MSILTILLAALLGGLGNYNFHVNVVPGGGPDTSSSRTASTATHVSEVSGSGPTTAPKTAVRRGRPIGSVGVDDVYGGGPVG